MPTFEELLTRHEQAADAATRAAVEAELWSSFGVEEAVLVLDMVGFSLLTLRHGVVHYLSMVRRMQRVVEPIVERFRGQVVKFEADNCFARFPGAADAVAAAVEILRGFEHLNVLRQDDDDIHIAVGVDYGRFLLVEGRDLFGNPVNLASKLGEDVARGGEILVTEAAVRSAGDLPGLGATPVRHVLAGVEVLTYRVSW